jgi:hypothetical protein
LVPLCLALKVLVTALNIHRDCGFPAIQLTRPSPLLCGLQNNRTESGISTLRVLRERYPGNTTEYNNLLPFSIYPSQPNVPGALAELLFCRLVVHVARVDHIKSYF